MLLHYCGSSNNMNAKVYTMVTDNYKVSLHCGKTHAAICWPKKTAALQLA